MTRRELLALASAGVLRAQAPPALKFRGLDHIEFTVTDVERSVAFYAQLFGGAEVMKNRTTTRRYIKLGASYMAIDRADAPRIDHVCIGIENFDIAAVHAFLTARGLTYRDYPSGRDTGVNDPDGTRLQLAAADGWTSLAAQTASPEPRDASAIFQPIGLFRVDINVSDLASGSSHYGKMLGPSPSRGYGVGQSRLDLYAGAPGYRRFAIETRRFEAVTKQLEDLGARIEPGTSPSTLQLRDPDGFLVEVSSSVRPVQVLR
jgi:catechol 2,3-dioxygenase-like lactoylglutathione lyase family enzyme